MSYRLFVLSVLCAGLSMVAIAGDSDVQQLLERVKKLEAKNQELETKLHTATAAMEKTKGVVAAVDKAMAKSDAKMGAVITAPDDGCRPLKIGGYLDFSYQYNFNRPDNQNNNLRVFDRDSNGFNMHYAELNFDRLPTNAGEAGFRMDLVYGTDADLQASIDNSGQGPDRLVDLQQAYISYIADIGNGITLDAGKFVTWSGYEVIEAYDNINSSRSILFGFAIPFAHTGIRATYPVFKDKWTVGLGVVNGWDNMQDQNDSKTAIFLSNWTPTKWFNWIVTGALGEEQFVDERSVLAGALAGPTLTNPDGGDFAGSDLDDPTIPGIGSTLTGRTYDPGDGSQPRFLIDTSFIFTPWENWTFVVNADWATEGGVPSANGPRNRQWWGVAGYLKYQFHKNWYIANRTEYFNDEEGVRTGRNQSLWESTVTVGWHISDPMQIRFEYRHDESNINSFSDTKGVGNGGVNFVRPFRSDSQDTLMMQWLYKF